MSQKNICEALEGIKEDRDFYSREFKKTRSRASEIRYDFLEMAYCRILYENNSSERNRRKYEKASSKYNSNFLEETFSMNHKYK